MDLRGRVKFPIGGDVLAMKSEARDSLLKHSLRTRLTWCNSKADGYSPDERRSSITCGCYINTHVYLITPVDRAWLHVRIHGGFLLSEDTIFKFSITKEFGLWNTRTKSITCSRLNRLLARRTRGSTVGHRSPVPYSSAGLHDLDTSRPD